MKLTRLKIHGFKSFVEATDIPIEEGITGIVGPNGCGKSNLVEALRFVMGESSYKAMRGGGMDDVIFSGAGSRPARNLAEVTLVAERRACSDGDDDALEITRRIEREAGSSYRLNGREVRARDVQLLFADAATGAHSSALVRQGQIAELIAAKPEKRRGILEDAAGIAGLHARRGEAETRLKGAEANLERLADLMGEIEGQLEGLRRQARQAVRYRKLSVEIRETEAVLHALNWENAVARAGEAQAQLAAVTVAFAAAAEAQTAAARDEAVAGAALPKLRDEAASAAASLQRLRAAAQEIEREEARLRIRRDELAARRAQAVADLEHQAEIAHDAEAALSRITEEESKLAESGADMAERLADARRQAEAAAAALGRCEVEFNEAAAQLAAAAAERAARQRALSEAKARLIRLGDERKSVVEQRDRLRAEAGAAEARDAAAEELAQAEAELAEAERQAQDAEKSRTAALAAEREARVPLEAAERHRTGLEAEARALAKLADREGPRRFPAVSDVLTVVAGYEIALAAALGDDLDAALHPDAPVHWGESADASDDGALPGGAEPLSFYVTAPDQLGRRLRQIGVIAAADAAELLPLLRPGQRLVTREGALWRWDGLHVRSGSVSAGARRLEQRSRLALLAKEIEQAHQACVEAAELSRAAKQARADAEIREGTTRAALRDARLRVELLRRALLEAERRAGRLAENLSAFAGALARLDADLHGAEAELRAAEEALARLTASPDLQARRDTLQETLQKARSETAALTLQADTAAHSEMLRQRRAAELAKEREEWSGRVGRSGERAAALAQRLEQIGAELAALEDDPAEFEQRRRALFHQITAAEGVAKDAADRLAHAEALQRRAAQVAREALETLSQRREARARDEERAIAAESRKAEIASEIAEQFGRPAHEIRALAGFTADATLPQTSAVEARLQRLRLEREKLGGVNLRADEEASEVEARLDSMRAEHADLQAAISRLRQAINGLNREGRERLLAAFETVNGHFQSLFRLLFNGGTAELALTGSDDPLEAGLDIVARPPGKRPQTMTLLSGGEQALTAMSLIFAVFLTNPSPVCVLDEVDAPLDDANVERFCALLEDMRRRTETRFLVITHNPITMARMDRLYGVTMAERGVSQLVSVDLEGAERFREAS